MRVTKGQNTIVIPMCVDIDVEVEDSVTLEREIDGLVFNTSEVEATYIPCQRVAVIRFTTDDMPKGRYKLHFSGKFKYSSLCWNQ